MKILHFNTSDSGGAAQGSWRIHQALCLAGMDSLYAVKYSSDRSKAHAKIIIPQDTRGFRFKKKIFSKALDRLYKNENHIYFTYNILANSFYSFIKNISPDIIHFHWIADGFISLHAMREIASLDIPVVWTIRDSWAMTGGCHFFSDCQEWQSGCKYCRLFKIPQCSLARYQWEQKKIAYLNISPHLISLSKQFIMYINQSPLLNKYPCSIISNTIDTKIFRPIPQNIARQILNIPSESNYILFSAIDTDDYRKGYDLLQNALSKITSHNVHCLVLGQASQQEYNKFPTHYLGYMHDQLSLAIIYSAADIFVCPSREESFSNTTLEALACGTPVVAFPVGAISEMVSHKNNGVLIPPYDTEKFAFGIDYLLKNEDIRKKMSIAAREKVTSTYSYPIIAKKHIDLYNNILSQYKHKV